MSFFSSLLGTCFFVTQDFKCIYNFFNPLRDNAMLTSAFLVIVVHVHDFFNRHLSNTITMRNFK